MLRRLLLCLLFPLCLLDCCGCFADPSLIFFFFALLPLSEVTGAALLPFCFAVPLLLILFSRVSLTFSFSLF
jgi:hypothetical protein